PTPLLTRHCPAPPPSPPSFPTRRSSDPDITQIRRTKRVTPLRPVQRHDGHTVVPLLPHAHPVLSSLRLDRVAVVTLDWPERRNADRKSTRLNSSHSQISYAVFCLKKKKK